MLNKEDIVSRLFKEDKITLEEMLVLLDKTTYTLPIVEQLILTPYSQPIFPDYPNPYTPPFTITCNNSGAETNPNITYTIHK